MQFTIVGDGVERDWLARRMRYAELTGPLHGEALASAYADFDLFVFPSESGAGAPVVLEALASGVPVVAMAAGTPTTVTGEGTGAVLARTHDELITLARSLVFDARRREGMRAEARRHALSLSWDRVLDDVYRAYRDAISLSASRRVSRPGVGVATDSTAGQRRS